MNSFNYTITHSKNKHLTAIDYDIIINEVIKFESKANCKRNTGKTQFLKSLALSFNTTLSNIYNIINKSKIVIKDTHLKEYSELNSFVAYNKRNHRQRSNNHKLNKATEFVNLIIDEVKSNKLSSIDETINYLKLHDNKRIEGMTTICTKTMYNYVKSGIIALKPIDLPRMVRRKTKKNYKSYIPKKCRGTSIEERPFNPKDKSQFGHWEGDLVVGPRDGKRGALLTLLERNTKAYFMIPISSKSSKKVYMEINKLHKMFGNSFSDVFKSITFDNGAEFSRYADIEKKPNTSIQRTKVYFGRPYRSSDRGCNENCNQLVRYFVKKGTDFNIFPREYIKDINSKINNKKRKINGYLPSKILFKNQLLKINCNINLDNTGFFS